MPPASNQRDRTLDIAKGLAIMLVIAGHIFQDRHADFDAFLPFRLIYAFHMPLFIFLSGMVAALRPVALLSLPAFKPRLRSAAVMVGHAARRLLIPFATWAVIGWLAHRRHEMGLAEWLLLVCRQPDYALWFLPTVFYCLCVWQLMHLLSVTLHDRLSAKNMPRAAAWAQNDFVLFPVTMVALCGALAFAAKTYGLDYIKLYFPFFIAGAFFQLYVRRQIQVRHFVAAAAIYAALAPFWDRLHPAAPVLWLGGVIPAGIGNILFRILVALSGTLTVIGLAKALAASRCGYGQQALGYCGIASLGIYAFHGYLVGVQPLFIAPLAGSLAFCWIVSKIPVASTLLLGQRAQNL